MTVIHIFYWLFVTVQAAVQLYTYKDYKTKIDLKSGFTIRQFFNIRYRKISPIFRPESDKSKKLFIFIRNSPIRDLCATLDIERDCVGGYNEQYRRNKVTVKR